MAAESLVATCQGGENAEQSDESGEPTGGTGSRYLFGEKTIVDYHCRNHPANDGCNQVKSRFEIHSISCCQSTV
jgi:hypothetical protein